MTTIAVTPSTMPKVRGGRAVNAVALFLEKDLHIPNVYIHPKLAADRHFDVFAIDGGGSGDFHAAEIKLLSTATSSLPNLLAYIKRLKTAPAHYKYLVLPDSRDARKLAQQSALFASNGIGRVGILLIHEEPESLPNVEVLVKPERFRLDPEMADRIAKALSKKQPDMFIRI